MTPFPSFPQSKEHDWGKGERVVWMKTGICIQDVVSCLPHFRSLKWGRQEGVALRELQSASGEELSALMPSVLDRAFKGEQ